MRITRHKFEYKWIILALCFIMNFVCLGFCSGNKGLYLTAITEALGIQRSLFSINDSCRYIATAVINLFFGSLIYRFGIKKMTVFGFVCLIASMMFYARANNIFVIYIGGTLLGLGVSFTTTTMTSSIIRRWFHTNIGKYTGIVFAANGIGGAIAAQILTPFIFHETDPFGYRTAYLIVACILLFVGIPVVILMKEQPNDQSVVVKNITKRNTNGRSWDALPYETVKKRPYFLITCIGVLLTGFILQGITGVYAAHLRDTGLDASSIATVASVFSLALTFSKIFVGALYDRYGLSTILVLCESATVIAFGFMLFITNSTTGLILSFLFAVVYAIALPLETLVIPLIVNEMFGAASYDKVLGIMIAMNYTGYALGTPIVNICYDTFGSYKPAFIAFMVIMPLIGLMFQIAIKGVDKDKQVLTNPK